jgi:hypothetical protein
LLDNDALLEGQEGEVEKKSLPVFLIYIMIVYTKTGFGSLGDTPLG